jgi:hypothetical protein
MQARASVLAWALVIAACEGGAGGGTDGGGADADGEFGPRDGGREDGGGPVPGGGELPCDVLEVVRTRCQTCHADPPMFGAPMPLVDPEDFQAPAITMPGERVYQRASVRIHDARNPMPPATSPPLTTEQIATLDAWFAAGAPARAEGTRCDEPPPEPPPETLPCSPSHRFLAHAPGSSEPYALGPGSTNQYICFTWRSPFGGSQQATAWRPVIGDARVLHHWILYRTATPQTDGGVGPCAMPGDAVFTMGWAPGGGVFVMPDDVGLELNQGREEWLILQVHYWNGAGLDEVRDASGVEICTVDTPRAQTAGVVTFGTVSISIPPRSRDHMESGTCPSTATRLLSQPLHVLASGPHMHRLGTRFVTDILRGGTSAETLVRVDPWNFDSQTFYRHEPTVQIQPGDAVRTTCWYDNPGSETVGFGERTEDEMCFLFAMVYPVSALPPLAPRACVVR